MLGHGFTVAQLVETEAGQEDIGEGNRMSRNVRGRLIALCLLACAIVTIGLAVAGVLQQVRMARVPVVVVTR
jgi:hypothetical protein